MPIELTVPQVGESITEVQIGAWLKQPGDSVAKDEPVVEIESDKATVELSAPAAGIVARVLKNQGETATVGEVIGFLEAVTTAGTPPPKPIIVPPQRPATVVEKPVPKPLAASFNPEPTATALAPGKPVRPVAAPPAPLHVSMSADREEETVPMTLIRKRIAQRLVQAQQSAALLTTFNELDMSAVVHLRKEHATPFQELYGIKLGFMSFFVKATIEALKLFPQINAEIRGDNIVYRNYYDIGIAVGGGKGLVVPILRNAERMSFAEIELAINDLAVRAKENKLKLEELEGGTFTISNGGVYGSLLSTPIINPPQSGILGLHAIQDRPVARDGQVVIRPMMYTALTYDHRIVDGREAVTFLKRIKEIIESPLRLLLEV